MSEPPIDPAHPFHTPVLIEAVLRLLDPQPGQIVVDATTGGAGHSTRILARLGPDGTLVAIDQDADMLEFARSRLVGNVQFVHGNFEDLPQILQRLQIGKVDAILADLGFSSDQLANPLRGLSFQQDGPLDMRLDQSRGEPVAALVRRLHEKDLADIFWQFGEERHSRRIARAIVQTREKTLIVTTGQLADLVRHCVPRSRDSHRIDPATRVFQALRIAVNDEIGALERLLYALPKCLKTGGRAAIISFHSLEDRLVKRTFRQSDLFEELNRKPVEADDEERRINPRARSAKLRVARYRGEVHVA